VRETRGSHGGRTQYRPRAGDSPPSETGFWRCAASRWRCRDSQCRSRRRWPAWPADA